MNKIVRLTLTLIMAIALTACGNKTAHGTFPNIDDADIPDVLETTVGTLGNVSFSSGITDNEDYKSILSVTFKETTEADYTTLMEHYKLTSIGNIEGALLFDWGKLQVNKENDSIFINALIRNSFDGNE